MNGLAPGWQRLQIVLAVFCVAFIVSACSSSAAPTAEEGREAAGGVAPVGASETTVAATPAMPVVWATEFCDAVDIWLVRLRVDSATALRRTTTDRAFSNAFADAARATQALAVRLKTAEIIAFAPPGVDQVTSAAETIAGRLAQAAGLAEATGRAGAHPDERHSLALTLVASQYALVNALVPPRGGGFSIQSVLRSEVGCPAFVTATSAEPMAFTEIAGYMLGVTREVRWAEDIDFVIRWLPKLHAARFFVDPGAKIEGALDDLKGRVPSLSDVEIWLELQKAVTLVADVHTEVSAVPGAMALSTLPVTFAWFSDGLYITGASARNRELVGKRVTRIGDVSAAGALEKLALYMPRENDWGVQGMVSPYLRTSEFLVAAGISAAGPVHFEFADGASVDLRPRREPTTPVNVDNRLPSWFRPIVGPYPVNEPDSGTVYVRIPSFMFAAQVEDAVTTLLAHVEEHQPTSLVIDFRGNNGGFFVVASDFVNSIARLKATRANLSVTVLTDGGTLSAAVGATIALRENAGARQVGQGTGQRPSFYGGVSYFVLPNSGLVVTFSAGYFPAPQKYIGGGLLPDVRVATSGVDVFQGRDPVLDVALRR